jgi:hypothetical protein
MTVANQSTVLIYFMPNKNASSTYRILSSFLGSTPPPPPLVVFYAIYVIGFVMNEETIMSDPDSISEEGPRQMNYVAV